jgi:hypothetical protein
MKMPLVDPRVRDSLAQTKFKLLAHGAQITANCLNALNGAKMPLRTRSGVSGGLDINLGWGVEVNVPIVEDFSTSSALILDHQDGVFIITNDHEELLRFEPIPSPAYYPKKTADGTDHLSRIAQMCSSDRLCYGMTGPTCRFWRAEYRCRYCSIGKNFNTDATRKTLSHLLETIDAAISDECLPARHLLLGGGTPPGDDMGALKAAELCSQIKARFDIPIYVMIAAPLTDDPIYILKDAGADELAMNIEFWSDEAWEAYIPGKRRIIGKKRYLAALEKSVALFGPINTRSILIAGLESQKATLEAVTALSGMGVMPIISPFRALAETTLESMRGFSGSEYMDLWQASEQIALANAVPIGPTCVPCQNNTLAMPPLANRELT